MKINKYNAICDEEIIFHYTNFTGALGILESAKIRLFSVHHLNDTKEMKEGAETAKRMMFSEMKSIGVVDDNIKKYFDSALGIMGGFPVFTASFSSEPDLLSQWRAYCRPHGYALGFSVKQIRELSFEHGMILGDVKYSRSEKEEVLRPAVQKLSYAIKADGSEVFLSKIKSGYYQKLFFELCESIAFTKNESFSEEREWRLTFVPRSPELLKRQKFIARASGIAPYVEIDLHKGSIKSKDQTNRDLCLRAINVSPGRNAHKRLDVLTNFINVNDIYYRTGGVSDSSYQDD